MTQSAFWLFLTMLPAFAHDAEPPTVTVHLYNLAGVPDGILNQATGIVHHLYAGTGVELKWVRQTASVARPGEGNAFRPSATPAEVSVRLLPKELSDGLVRSGSAKLGFVYPAEKNAYRYLATVLYDRVERAARELYDIPLPLLLGYIMAHELGHLLLGPDAHARGTSWRARGTPANSGSSNATSSASIRSSGRNYALRYPAASRPPRGG